MKPMQGIFRRMRRFGTCREGSTLIELAFAAPVVIFSIIAMIEILTIMFVTTLMEGAVREASRFGITGFVPPGSTREQVIADIVKENTLGLVDIQPDTITTLVYLDFDKVGQPEPLTVDVNGNGKYDAADGDQYTDVNGNGTWDLDQGATGVGGASDVVLYTISYDWKIFTPLMAAFIGNNGVVKLSASVAVRNEPFGP